MADHTIVLRSNREFAHRMVDAAPMGSVMAVTKPRRSLDQNALMWTYLTRISAAKPEGRELTPDVWKALFLHALNHSQRFEMALDGKGMVPVGFRTSKLDKRQMADLLTVIEEYAARHSIELERV